MKKTIHTTWGRTTLMRLREKLATLYADSDAVRRVLREVDLPAQHVSFHGRAANTWSSVLEEAELRGRLNALLELVFLEYPEETERLFTDLTTSVQTAPAMATEGITHEDLTGPRSALVPVRFLERGLQVARPVGLVILRDGSVGSGFLLRDDYFVTCSHVIPTDEQAETATIRFNYEESIGGATAHYYDYKVASKIIVQSPQELGYDFTVVKLLGNPTERWGYLPITERRATLHERVNIIQHPNGELKQLSYFHNIVVRVDEVRIEYKTDTREGSSGSPVFDKEWNVVAVHRGSRPTLEIPRSEHLKRNVGTHIDVVSRALAKKGIVGLGHDANR